jgi:hypothetical protein
MPVASSIFPALFSTSYKVSGLILRSLVHFEKILVQSERHGYSLFSAGRYPVFSATFVEGPVLPRSF